MKNKLLQQYFINSNVYCHINGILNLFLGFWIFDDTPSLFFAILHKNVSFKFCS